jgi:hypothetical protein
VHLRACDWTPIGAILDGAWRPARTVGSDSNPDWREQVMNKGLSIALGVVIALAAASTAQADPTAIQRLATQERAKHVVLSSTPQTSVQRIIAQERGRRSDARLFHPTSSAPVLVAGQPDRFDVRDAVIGGSAVLVLALVAAAAVAFNGGRRNRAGRAAPAES